MKTWQLVTAGLVVVVVGVLGTLYYVAGTPQYSLYVIRKAVRAGDRATFYAHFDTAKVVSSAIQRELRGILPAGPGIVSKKAQDMLIPASEKLIKDRIEARLDEPEPIQQLAMSIDDVKYTGNAAFVTLSNPADGSTTVVQMEQLPNRHWKIVDVDLEKAAIPYSLNEAREKAEQLLPPMLPTPSRPKL